MRTLCLGLLCVAPFALLPALALAESDPATGGRFDAYGQVLKVTPIVHRERVVEPYEHCRVVQDPRPTRNRPPHRRHIEPPHRVVRSLVGSLIGGAIGNQFGGGRGKKGLTVLGALAGARIANGHRPRRDAYDDGRYADHPYSEPTPVTGGSTEQCTQTERTRYVDQVSGYRVRYKFNGETYTKITDDHPGDRIPLDVRITPRMTTSR